MTLREATLADSERLLEWRNDPETRLASRVQEPVTPEEHAEWLAGEHTILIGEASGEPVGTVRFDRVGEGYEISVSVDPSHRDRGVGTRLIADGVNWLWKSTPAAWCQAVVRNENKRSLRAFRKVGFEGSSDYGFTCLVKERPAEGPGEPWFDW